MRRLGWHLRSSELASLVPVVFHLPRPLQHRQPDVHVPHVGMLLAERARLDGDRLLQKRDGRRHVALRGGQARPTRHNKVTAESEANGCVCIAREVSEATTHASSPERAWTVARPRNRETPQYANPTPCTLPPTAWASGRERWVLYRALSRAQPCRVVVAEWRPRSVRGGRLLHHV